MSTASSTKQPKGKNNKDVEKKSVKKAEDLQQVVVEEEDPSVNDSDEEDADEAEEEEEADEDSRREVETSKEEDHAHSVTEIYDGPMLTDVIIESFEGKRENGLFEGEGFIKFIDGHTYEGHFHEGFMHGNGSYKWADGVIYEGEFDHNRISGKGVYTYPDGSSYEGEVLDGKRHGYGIYRFKDNAMSYTGQWYMGCKHGKGHLQYDSENNSFYDGDWVNDRFHGWGKRRYPNGNEYEGMWFNSKRHIDGTMKWFSSENSKSSEIYRGQWREGTQHGFGEHIWMTYRLPGTQFNTRNSYIGQFVNGRKHGKGIFQYADGAKYDGEWYEDMKHGPAKFTLRTGETHTCQFINNNLPPNTVIPGLPSLFYGIPCVPGDSEKSTTDINFLLDIEDLLKDYPKLDKKQELEQISNNIWRHIASLKAIYGFYSRIGCKESPDNIYLMNNFQYWRFLKDCYFHHQGYTLMEMDRIIEKSKNPAKMHNPFTKLLQREFIANIIILSFHLYHKKYMSAKVELKQPRCMLDWCFSHLLKNNIFPFAFQVKGYFYHELRKAMNVFEYVDKVYPLYKSLCVRRKHAVSDPSFRMRDFLFLLKDLELINRNLTIECILKILANDDATIMQEGCYNLELEMTFLEFMEALVGCAEVYVTKFMVESFSSEFGAKLRLLQHHSPSSAINLEMSSLNLIAGTTAVTAGPGSMAADEEAAGSAQLCGTTVKSSPDEISPVQATVMSTSAMNTPITTRSPELSFLDNCQVSLDTDTKLDMRRVPDLRVSSSHDFTKEVSVEECVASSFEDIDQPTKKYNFWVRQIHIFFIQKFIGPVQELLEIRRTAHQKVRAILAERPKKSLKTTSVSEASFRTDNILDAERSETISAST